MIRCQTFSTGFNARTRIWSAAATVMLSGIASLGVKCQLGLIDDQHRMGAIDGGTDLDEVRRHGVGCRTRA